MIDDQKTLLVYLITWLGEDLADAHRVYPARGRVKSISFGEGFGISGEHSIELSPEARVTRRERKRREYSVEDKNRHDVETSVTYLYDVETGALESRVHCNGRFFERHVFEFDAAGTTANRYTINPDGSRESRPTMTFSYEPKTQTLSQKETYITHEKLCDPNWSMSSDPYTTSTTFVFGESGFVTDIIAGDDPSAKQYKHWQFVEDGNGSLMDTFMFPDTHLYRQEYGEYDSHGNPAVLHRSYAISRFGAVDFESDGDTLFRREYFEK